MPKTLINDFFQNRIETLQQKADELEHTNRYLSIARTLVFLLGLVLIVYLANERSGLGLTVSAFASAVIFSIVVKVHNARRFEWQQTKNLILINQEELLRTKGQLHDLPSGEEYFDDNHPYTPDLDVFGHNSMFQLLSRSRLTGTNKLMKDWLLKSANAEEINARQTAVKELTNDVEFRQRITALGYDTPSSATDMKIERLTQWMDTTLSSFDKPKWRILQWFMPAFAIAILVIVSLSDLPYYWYALPLLVNSLVFRSIFSPLLEITKEMDGVSKHFRIYTLIIRIIKEQTFRAEKLQALSGELTMDNHSAADAIGKLDRILYFLESRANMIYVSLNSYFLTDLFILNAAQNWKKKNLSNLGQWLKAVHEMETLNDLASFSAANPDYTFPQITEENYTLQASALGHPMIKPSQRVVNDFSMQNAGQLGLVTGSNMSGKSTFLRTIGVNLVLAQMGAPVCATDFRFSLTRIFTSMRTQDNLEENVSSFYAELKRIKMLLDSLGDEPIFYMLDEILKGTNSEDRHKGAMALIDQLTQSQCMGLISTHDIQLSKLAESNPHLLNQSFNSEIKGDEIIFDYKLTNGPCKSFNASKLMEQMGIIK